MREVNVGPASEIADPGRKLIGFENFEVAVFKLGGEFFAYLNHCPHMGGPACQGKMIAKVEEDIAADRTSKGMTFSKSKMHVSVRGTASSSTSAPAFIPAIRRRASAR